MEMMLPANFISPWDPPISRGASDLSAGVPAHSFQHRRVLELLFSTSPGDQKGAGHSRHAVGNQKGVGVSCGGCNALSPVLFLMYPQPAFMDSPLSGSCRVWQEHSACLGRQMD